MRSLTGDESAGAPYGADHPPPLAADDVHVWRASLERDAAAVARCAALLAPDERERAARFRFARDRRHFVVCRGTLRRLLGGYLDDEPRAIHLATGAHGKPRLDPPRDALEFNVSHSWGLALLAFARGRRVGVDVERIRDDLDTESIAAGSFSRAELAELRALPRAARLEGFFAGWTRKEAFIKATGAGVSYGLDVFDVSLGPGRPARLLRARGGPAEAGRWGMSAWRVGGFAAALVVEGRGWRVRHLTVAAERDAHLPRVRAQRGPRQSSPTW